MHKNFTHIGLSLALVLPPLPFPLTPSFHHSTTVQQQVSLPDLHGQIIPTSLKSTIFLNSVNGLTVQTTITKTKDELVQDVQMTGTKESIHFQLTLLLNDPILHSQQSRQIATQDEFIFSQTVQDNKILTKELIITNAPNTKDGSTYQWRFSSDSNITLDMLMNGTIAQIQPFLYWTKQGHEKIGHVSVTNNLLTLNIKEPKESYPLIIDPSIAYGQWLGDGTSAVSTAAAVAVETATGEIYVGGTATGAMLNVGTIVGTYVGTAGTAEGYVVELTSANPPVINWMHYLGGAAGATITSLVINGDEVYAGGYSTVSSSWETAGSIVGSVVNVADEAFVVEIADGVSPTLSWRVWVGGTGPDYIYALAINGDEIYAGGSSASSTQWDTVGSVVGTKIGAASDSFVEEIVDGSPPTHTWHMWLGGDGGDVINSLAVNGDEIYAGGYSSLSDSWDTAGSNVGTFTDVSVNEGFVVEIADGGPPTLAWHMWVGGSGADQINALAVNGDEIYAGGTTPGAGDWDTAGSNVGTYTNTNSEGFLVEIGDGGPPTLDWHMWLGGRGGDNVLALAVNGDEVYAFGHSASTSSWDTAGVDVGTWSNNGVQELFVVEISDGGPPSIAWKMWLGGVGSETPTGLAVNGNAVYAVGYVNNSSAMETFTVVSGNLYAATNNGAFVGELNDAATPTYFWLQWLTGSGISQINALAVTGDEIYAGGQSYVQTLGTVPDVGTPNYAQEGFVVEIADGATPSLNWRVWLGGQGASTVNALAINGDEIYAGGYTTSTGSWDTAGSLVGTQANTLQEGFVVEIADGSPPTLAWRMWLGGSAADIVYALAVNGDEIYAAGYTATSPGWETFGSVVGTLTNNQDEGFVVELADAGPPTFEWLAFIGGSNHDYIYSLAVTGDEIYAGGASDTSVSWDTFASTLGTMSDALYEGFVVEIGDGGPPTFEWRVWLGGNDQDRVYAVAANGDEIYAGGYADNTATFETAVISFGTVTNTSDKGFVVEIADGSPPDLAWRMWIGGSGVDGVRALAVSGDEIYASGYSYASGSWAAVDSKIGTFTNAAVVEGFVTEISDGSPPSMKWIIWLGGIGVDDALTLALSGDEVYVGGYVPNSQDMEGVFSGTKYAGQNSGYIVEIGDDTTAIVMPAVFWSD